MTDARSRTPGMLFLLAALGTLGFSLPTVTTLVTSTKRYVEGRPGDARASGKERA